MLICLNGWRWRSHEELQEKAFKQDREIAHLIQRIDKLKIDRRIEEWLKKAGNPELNPFNIQFGSTKHAFPSDWQYANNFYGDGTQDAESVLLLRNPHDGYHKVTRRITKQELQAFFPHCTSCHVKPLVAILISFFKPPYRVIIWIGTTPQQLSQVVLFRQAKCMNCLECKVRYLFLVTAITKSYVDIRFFELINVSSTVHFPRWCFLTVLSVHWSLISPFLTLNSTHPTSWFGIVIFSSLSVSEFQIQGIIHVVCRHVCW